MSETITNQTNVRNINISNKCQKQYHMKQMSETIIYQTNVRDNNISNKCQKQ